MAYDVFAADLSIDDDTRERCRRVIDHSEAPRTYKRWLRFAHLVSGVFESEPKVANDRSLRIVKTDADK